MILYEISKLPYGKYRRTMLIKWIEESEYHSIPVNKAGMMNAKDPDLQYLMKRGILKIYRPVSRFSKYKKSSTGRQTYLILK